MHVVRHRKNIEKLRELTLRNLLLLGSLEAFVSANARIFF